MEDQTKTVHIVNRSLQKEVTGHTIATEATTKLTGNPWIAIIMCFIFTANCGYLFSFQLGEHMDHLILNLVPSHQHNHTAPDPVPFIAVIMEKVNWTIDIPGQMRLIRLYYKSMEYLTPLLSQIHGYLS